MAATDPSPPCLRRRRVLGESAAALFPPSSRRRLGLRDASPVPPPASVAAVPASGARYFLPSPAGDEPRRGVARVSVHSGAGRPVRGRRRHAISYVASGSSSPAADFQSQVLSPGRGRRRGRVPDGRAAHPRPGWQPVARSASPVSLSGDAPSASMVAVASSTSTAALSERLPTGLATCNQDARRREIWRMAPSRLPSSSPYASGEEATATTKVRTTDVRSSASVRPRHHRRRLYNRPPFAPPDVAATPCPYDHAVAEEDRTTGRHSIHQSPDAGAPPFLCDQVTDFYLEQLPRSIRI